MYSPRHFSRSEQDAVDRLRPAMLMLSTWRTRATGSETSSWSKPGRGPLIRRLMERRGTAACGTGSGPSYAHNRVSRRPLERVTTRQLVKGNLAAQRGPTVMQITLTTTCGSSLRRLSRRRPKQVAYWALKSAITYSRVRFRGKGSGRSRAIRRVTAWLRFLRCI
jgi:hypothetical protein